MIKLQNHNKINNFEELNEEIRSLVYLEAFVSYHEDFYSRTVNYFVRVSAKYGNCTVVVNTNGTFVQDKMRRFKGECAHFRFNKCPIYTRDGANTKFSTISHETDYCA
jgi:hypothetical protein